ncbi:Cation/H(+) antiporter 15 Protein CATION/H+ EXCHANGER 15 [Vigna angularis]|uniref:Cation/H(+) antiporter 15 Protein CATION/H+ EXCHANGER 15 n=1 Tax=Phaseolus angularis TaxID=3914 RepID=A0A8T0L481_PHAAN|nr:cation/H(+) antiporter 15-like [Vigna angularis]KAG2406391.1 Cation/H(+) antiporter 15 Protein CATION/H+ EXCHANGER 15 [Vigna angularis]
MTDTLPACYNVFIVNRNQFWKTDKVLQTELPILAIQIAFVAVLSRLFSIIYKPLHQTRLISQISVGFLLTPPLLGRFTPIFEFIFPVNGIVNVEVLSHIGLIYYAFLSGLEMNLNTILHMKKKPASITIVGIIFPMLIAPCLYALFRKVYGHIMMFPLEESTDNTYILWTLILTVTSFPVVAHTLSELKLLYTGLGKAALTAAMIGDTYGWILFTLFVPFSTNGKGAIYTVPCTIIFIVVCIFVVRPIIQWFIDRKADKDEWNDNQLLFIIMGVLACSCISDFLGAHAIVGAFVFGLILPHGRFAELVMSISDDFVGGFLVPLFFTGTGMRLMLASIFSQQSWPFVVVIILLLCALKILSTLIVTLFFGMRIRDGLTLGLILNNKGAMALIMLNIAWDRMIFSVPTYAVITSAVLLMTIVVSPVINVVYKPRQRFEQNKLKTIQKLRVDAELRIISCVHNTRQATSMISIVECFNAMRVSPIHVFALYLVELTGRTAALVAAHIGKPSSQPGEQNLTRSQEELESIHNAFDALGEAYDAIRVETLNVVSTYTTIHEDIYHSADEKHTSLILLPFHKQLTLEGTLEVTSVVYKDINQNVMQGAPCSVGIFVDRDFGLVPKRNLHVRVVFVGGPDDREALAIAWRMAGCSGTQLSVVRILLLGEAAEADASVHDEAQGILSAVIDTEKQKELDDEYISTFRLTGVHNNDLISYSEIDVRSGEDIPAILNEIEKFGCDLYIVGQGNCRNSKVFSNLLEWCECLELGVIGDILVSNNFGSRSSVLVVQQYGYGGMNFRNNLNQKDTNNNKFESVV